MGITENKIIENHLKANNYENKNRCDINDSLDIKQIRTFDKKYLNEVKRIVFSQEKYNP